MVAGSISLSSRAWETAHPVRVTRLKWNISGINTVADAGIACRSASYDPGAGGALSVRNAGSTR